MATSSRDPAGIWCKKHLLTLIPLLAKTAILKLAWARSCSLCWLNCFGDKRISWMMVVPPLKSMTQSIDNWISLPWMLA
jgi:hypothetical protein